MAHAIPVIDRGALEAMHTGSLLSRLRQLLACEESLAHSDRLGDESGQPSSRIIEFKDTDEWIAAHRDLKEILAHREHLPTAEERQNKRMARAASNRFKEKRK
jgi:hypothetical protein